MKLIKSTIFASLALATAALTACSSDEKYEVGSASDGAYFPDGLAETVEASNEVSVYEVPVYRASAGSQTSFEVTSTVSRTMKVNGKDQVIENPEGISVPTVVTFSGTSLQSSLPITYDVNTVDQDVVYTITLEIKDASDYGSSTYDFDFTVTSPKQRELWDGSLAATENYAAVEGRDVDHTGYYNLTALFSGTFSGMEIYKEYNPNVDKDRTFSVVFSNMFDWYDNSTGVDFKINILDTNDRDADGNIPCEILEQAVNYPGYDFYVSDRYHYLVDVYGLDEEGEVAQSWKNASYFNPETGMFTMYLVYYLKSTGSAYGADTETAQLDGYPKCSLSISYGGRTVDKTMANFIVANFTSGEDTNLVKAAIFKTSEVSTPYRVDTAVSILESGKTQDVEAGEDVAAEFQIEESGSYMILGVTYDSSNKAQDFAYITFYTDLTVEEGWTTIGTATFTDGWFLPYITRSTNPARYPWDVEVRQNKNYPDYYQLVTPYNCDNFKSIAGDYNDYENYFRNITLYVMDENYVEVLPQYAGVGYSYVSLAELGVANLEGMLYTNYSSSGFTRKQIETIVSQAGYKHSTFSTDKIITIPYPYSMLTFESGSTWCTATSDYFDGMGLPSDPYPVEIILPEATLQTRAAHKARSVAKPTFQTLTSSIETKQYTRVKLNKFKTFIPMSGNVLAVRKK